MNESVELHLSWDEDDQLWVVWFPHPLGGREVLGQFLDEAMAQEFWQEQMDGADFNA